MKGLLQTLERVARPREPLEGETFSSRIEKLHKVFLQSVLTPEHAEHLSDEYVSLLRRLALYFEFETIEPHRRRSLEGQSALLIAGLIMELLARIQRGTARPAEYATDLLDVL